MELDDLLYRFLRWTIPLWLVPYILWFFARRSVLVLYDWLTAPHAGERSRGKK